MLISVRGTNNTVVARDDIYSVPMNSTTNLPVLANDTGTNLHIGWAYGAGNNIGSAAVAFDGKSIVYTPHQYSIGQDVYRYLAVDGASNSDQAMVTVNVLAPPGVTINNPMDGNTYLTNTVVTVAGTVWRRVMTRR